MGHDDVRRVVDVWAEEYGRLGGIPFINYVQIFENKGQMMGCSNPHPHGQIWAQNSLPDEPARETGAHGGALQGDGEKPAGGLSSRRSSGSGRGSIAQNDGFAALVPYWAVWPFEVLIISRRHFGSLLGDVGPRTVSAGGHGARRWPCAMTISSVFPSPTRRGIHQSPTDQRPHPEWHFHMHFYPPLLRSATVRKFMVGYEMLADPQRDITPELSAERLRSFPEKHYKEVSTSSLVLLGIEKCQISQFWPTDY